MYTTTVLYQANYESEALITVNQGGTSSGKTYAIDQTLFNKLGERDKKVCTVVGQDIPNLRVGALRDALEIYENTPILQQLIKSYNKSNLTFTFNNGSLMEFKSYDSPQDAKSGKRDYLFINEANGIPYPIFKELYLRTRIQTYIDYNPNSEFWVHEHLIGKPHVKLLISDHTHNPFLPQHMRDNIEALREEDEELWKVYARGLTGKIEGLVFRKTAVVNEIPADAKLIAFGLDFGFTNDPTACVEVRLQNGELWVQEHLYDRGLTNPDIANKLQHVKDSRFEVVADSAEPKSIEELKRLGLKVEPAMKGPDSIKNSIDILKRYTINVTRGSVNLRKELDNYKWKVDRATGKPLNEPIDAFNHAIDALRYVALNRLSNKSTSSLSNAYQVF